jgi:hypothetical protein
MTFWEAILSQELVACQYSAVMCSASVAGFNRTMALAASNPVFDAPFTVTDLASLRAPPFIPRAFADLIAHTECSVP